MARYHPPDYLPSEVLARPDFVEACKARNLGRILDIARRYGGIGFSVSHLARRCEMTVSQVQDYIVRGREARKVEIFERAADGLHIPGHMLGLGSRPWEAKEQDPVDISATVPADSTPGISASALTIPGQDGVPIPADIDAGADADIMLMLQEADRTDIGSSTIETLYTIFDKLCRDYPSVAAPE